MSQSKPLTRHEQREIDAWLESCRIIKQQTSVPAPPETAKEKEKRIAGYKVQSVEAFIDFANYYFNYSGSLAPFGWFHKEGIKDTVVDRNPRNIWEWSRESAKSVLADIMLPSYLLVTGWLEGMILGSVNETKADILIKDLEAQLRNNQRLIADFGDFGIQGSWAQGYYYTTKGEYAGIGFWSFGIGQEPAGTRDGFRRPNYGVIDEADSKMVSKNQERTQERIDWIKGEFLGCLQTKGFIAIYVNNRVAAQGLTAHMVGDTEKGKLPDPDWKHIKVYFTEDPKTHEAFFPLEDPVTRQLMLPENGNWAPSWKENFTPAQCLEKIKTYGRRNAMRQLYHTEQKEGTVFKDEVWRKVLPLPQYDQLVSYCDPSFGESKNNDYKAIALVGRKGAHFDIIWAWCRQGSNLAMVSAHFNIAKKLKSEFPDIVAPSGAYGFKVVSAKHYVEANLLQKMLLKPMYEDLSEITGEEWNPRYDERKKAPKEDRIEALSVLWENGSIGFNEDLREDKDMLTIVDQFLSFPAGHDDGPDAVEGAISLLNKKKGSSDKGKRATTGKYAKNPKRS